MASNPGAYSAAPAVVGLQPSGDTTGATDTPRLKALLATPNGCIMGAGTFYYNATLTIPGVQFMGQGWGNTVLQPVAGFAFDGSGAMMNVTGANADIGRFKHLGGPSASFASNPAGNGIQLQPGAQYADIHDLSVYYQNGWEIEYLGGGTSATIVGTMIRTMQRFQNKQGFHFKGSSASNWNGQLQIMSIQAGQISGPSLRLEDIQDVAVDGYNDSVVGGVAGANALQIIGNCSAIRVTAPDLGQFPNTAGNTPTQATVLIDDSVNGAPNDVTLGPGIIQQGGQAGNVVIQNTNGGSLQRIHVYSRIAQGQGHGASVTASVGFDISFYDAPFSSNGQAAGTFQEISWTGAASGNVKRCIFSTAQGAAGGGQVTNVASFVGAGQVAFDDCEFNGAGITVANAFGTTPKFTRRIKGYTPTGAVAIAVPGSGVATAGRSFDMTFYITAGASTCSCAVSGGGPTVVIPSGGFGSLRIPAGQTFTPTYASAPSWVVEGES